MKIYRSETEIKILLEKMCDWIIMRKQQGLEASSISASQEFGVPKTTFLRWVDRYLREISLEKYEMIIDILEKNNKKNDIKRSEMNQRTYELAYAILAEENKDFTVTEIISQLGYDRKRSMNLIYNNLKELDKTENKSLYVSVLKRIIHNSNKNCKATDYLAQVQKEIEDKNKNSSTWKGYTSVDLKILKAARLYLAGESLEEIACKYQVSVSDIIVAFEEVLGNIDLDLYKLIIRKLNSTNKINAKRR